MILLGTFDLLTDMLVFVMWGFTTLVSIAVIILRLREAETKPAIYCPLVSNCASHLNWWRPVYRNCNFNQSTSFIIDWHWANHARLTSVLHHAKTQVIKKETAASFFIAQNYSSSLCASMTDCFSTPT